MPDKYELALLAAAANAQTPNTRGTLPPFNLPNPNNTDRAILERIEHKLDMIFAKLVAGDHQ